MPFEQPRFSKKDRDWFNEGEREGYDDLERLAAERSGEDIPPVPRREPPKSQEAPPLKPKGKGMGQTPAEKRFFGES